MSRSFLARGLAVLLLATLCACSAPQGPVAVTRLTGALEPLRSEFNKDFGKVRLLVLADPT